MDTVKSFKGYGKVDEVEERTFRQKTRRRILLIGVSAIVLVIVVIGAVIGTVVHNNNNKSDSKNPTTSTAQTIKGVCSVTQYPESCISSLSSVQDSNKITDPKQLFKLSMQIAINEISRISSLPDQFISNLNDTLAQDALRNCKELFDDSIDQLNTSISSMTVGGGESLSSQQAQIDDIKTWISTAITDQETCLDGLNETTKSDVFNEMKMAMKNSTEFTSNSLAIVTKVMSVIDHLNIPVHRKLLGYIDHHGSDFPSWLHPMDRRLLQVANPKADITVAKDGSGNFRTITAAIKAVGKKNKARTVIYVKQGEYVENVVLDKTCWNIMMYGDGKAKTVVSGSSNVVDGTPTFSTAPFIVVGKGFIAKDMRFVNTAGPQKHQAVALRSGSDQSVFYQCSFSAYQDTLYAHSNRQFYRECDITGTVDFIFGNAAVIFQNCNIQPRQPLPNQFNTLTAQGKIDPNQNTGISIQGCTIAALGNVTVNTYLGRPWKNFSTTIIMKSVIGSVVSPPGWTPWVTNIKPASTIFYAEYQNTGPGSSVAQRVTWAKPTATADEAAKFTVEPFIQGSQWLPQAGVTFTSAL